MPSFPWNLGTAYAVLSSSTRHVDVGKWAKGRDETKMFDTEANLHEIQTNTGSYLSGYSRREACRRPRPRSKS